MASIISKESIGSLSGKQKVSKLTKKLQKIHNKYLLRIRSKKQNDEK